MADQSPEYCLERLIEQFQEYAKDKKDLPFPIKVVNGIKVEDLDFLKKEVGIRRPSPLEVLTGKKEEDFDFLKRRSLQFGFLSKLISAKNTALPSPGQRLWTLLPQPIQTLIEESVSFRRIKKEDKFNIINELNKILDQRDFYQKEDFSGLSLPNEVQGLLTELRKSFLKDDFYEGALSL